jgi:predicted dehydrogenase
LKDVEKMLGVAVIGCGLVSRVHLDALKKLEFEGKVSLEIACDLIKERAKDVKHRYKFRSYTTNCKDVARSKDVDVAFVLLPVYLHRKVSVELMNSGKHVLVEKPMAMNKKECIEMVRSMEKNNVILYVGHVKRENEAYRLAKENVDKYISPVYLIKSCERWYGANHFLLNLWRADPASSGGGIWMDIGCHYVDIFRYIVGEIRRVYLTCNMFPEDIMKQVMKYEVGWQEKVKATYGNIDEFEKNVMEKRLEGNALSSIEFDCGALGEIDVGWCTKSPEMYCERTEIFGHGGIIVIESYPFYKPVSPKMKIYLEGESSGWIESTNLTPIPEAFYRQAKSFIHAIERGESNSALDGMKAVEVVQAGYLSFKKKHPVTISDGGAAL